MADLKLVKAIVIPLAVVLFLLIILLSASYSNVEYYEYGFLKRKSTGKVITTKVYSGGHHLVGPDYTYLKYRAAAHFVTKSNVAIFTSDRLEVWITASFQYFLRKSDLKLLHDNYNVYYEDIISSNALDALKVAATPYSTDEFIKERDTVEVALFKAVRERLGGICCEEDCGENTTPCVAGCKKYSDCLDTDKGLFVSVKYFQLQEVSIPSDVGSRYLRSLVLQEETEKATFEQQGAIVTRKTEAAVQEINNKAIEIAQNAAASSSLITAWASANSTATIERARSQGLKILYNTLGLSDEDYKSSFDYLRTIKDMSNAHLSVDFNQLIAGPVN